MGDFVSVEQDGQEYFMIVVRSYSNGDMVLVDFTKPAEKAIEEDGCRNGRNFGFEFRDALEYAKYIREHMTFDNLHEFGTDKYRIVMMRDGRIEDVERNGGEEDVK